LAEKNEKNFKKPLTVSRFHAKVCILRLYAGGKRGKKGDLFPQFRI
jgi:hypothetical protein